MFIDGEIVQSQEETTQGDPLAMGTYGDSYTLIKKLDYIVKQVWFPDDATAGGKLVELCDCGTTLAQNVAILLVSPRPGLF